jgi:RNA polymerase sigma-70 factor (ECF subfamily)
MPEVPPETRWIQRAQNGDGEAFGYLVERYQRRIAALVFRIIRRPNDVEDLAQEIFLKAYRTMKSYNFQASFSTWLSQVAVNHCYDFLRKERASKVTYHGDMSEERVRRLEAGPEFPDGPGTPNPEQEAAAREIASKLLERAPADDRIVLSLKELEGYSVEEIAEILSLKPSTVKVRLHRARKRMLEDMKELLAGR